MGKFRHLTIGLILIATFPVLCAMAQSNLTQIRDTIYNSNGTPFSGTVTITWNGSFTGMGGSVSPFSTSTRIYNGAFSALLVPTTTAVTGTFYQALYVSNDGTAMWTETWQVPASSSALTIAAVRISSTASSSGNGSSNSGGNPGIPKYATLPIAMSDVTNLNSSLGQINSSVLSLTNTSNGLTSSVAGLSSSLTSLGSNVAGISNTVSGLNSTVTGLSSSYNSLNGSVAGISNTVTGLSSTVTGLNSSYNSLSGSVTGIGNTVNGLSSTVTGLSSSYNSLSSNVTGIGNTVNGLSSTVTGLSSSYNSLNSNVTGIGNTVSGLSSSYNTLNNSVGGISSSVNSLTSSLSGIGSTVTTQGSTLTALNNSVGSLTSSMNSLSATVNNLSVAVANSVAFVDAEAPAGSVDGTNNLFMLSQSPIPVTSLEVYRNGLVQASGVDYSFAGSTISFLPSSVPQSGDLILAYYRTSGSQTGMPSFSDHETPGGILNGWNAAFTLTYTPFPAQSLKLYKNGMLLQQGNDYALSGNVITFVQAATPQPGDSIACFYRH